MEAKYKSPIRVATVERVEIVREEGDYFVIRPLGKEVKGVKVRKKYVESLS